MNQKYLKIILIICLLTSAIITAFRVLFDWPFIASVYFGLVQLAFYVMTIILAVIMLVKR